MIDKGTVLRRFGIENFGPCRDVDSDLRGEQRCVLADIFFSKKRLATSILGGGEDDLFELLELCRGDAIAAETTHGRHQWFKDALDGEDLLLRDTEEIVVIGRAGDDRSGCLLQIGRLIHNDGRITRTGNDRTLSTTESGPRDRWPSGDDDQLDIGVIEEFLGRVDGRGIDDRHQIINADLLADCFVEQPNPFFGDVGSARMAR